MEENIWESNFHDGEVKKAINILIWTYGHPKMMLDEAEELANEFHNKFAEKCLAIKLKQTEGIR